jgi:hypothetical protein
MRTVITLVERDFLYGAAVLYNSLVANGFEGRFAIGYRSDEDLPVDLLAKMRTLPQNLPSIEWIQLDTPWHFTNYKAQFIKDVFDRFPEAESVVYMDPDIVVTCPWAWMASWSTHGPTLCGDVNWMMPPAHPTRHEWNALLAEVGLTEMHSLHIYFNGGFLGLQRKDIAFAELWHRLTETFGQRDNPLDGQGDIAAWRKGGRWKTIHSPNQDTLNMAAMAWAGPLTTLGPDAMGFCGGWRLLPHALGANKPWRRAYMREAFGGNMPRAVDKAFWENASNPIHVYSAREVARARRSMKIAAALGRLYRRGSV